SPLEAVAIRTVLVAATAAILAIAQHFQLVDSVPPLVFQRGVVAPVMAGIVEHDDFFGPVHQVARNAVQRLQQQLARVVAHNEDAQPLHSALPAQASSRAPRTSASAGCATASAT